MLTSCVFHSSRHAPRAVGMKIDGTRSVPTTCKRGRVAPQIRHPRRRSPMSPVSLALVMTLFLGAAPPETAKEPVDSFKPDPAWKELSRSLWFDKHHRRLVMRARVVLREGP